MREAIDSAMRIGEAFRWFADGQKLAWRALRAGTLGKAGLRPAVGAFARPLTAPSRYPEYAIMRELLAASVDLDDPATWLYDVSSPKLFSLLLAAHSRATVVATDIWKPAIDEADALRGGLGEDAARRLHLAVADGREPVPPALRPPGGSFAAAFSMSVIEHVEPDPGGDRLVLERLADAVRPGGVVVFSVPVDVAARSEYLPGEVYGRKPDGERGAFFQRVYDAASLRALCASVAPRLRLDACVLSAWPSHPIMRLQPRFPTAVGFAGASFPLLSSRFTISAPSSDIPDIRAQGDAIVRLVVDGSAAGGSRP